MINNVGFRRHTLKGFLVWELPKTTSLGKTGNYLVNGWQLSAVYTGGSGAPYDVTYTYASNGANVNLTGSPNYVARVNVGKDAGAGCSGNPYALFNAAAFSGPSYNSTGNESGFDTVPLLLQQHRLRIPAISTEQRQIRHSPMRSNVFNTTVIVELPPCNPRQPCGCFDDHEQSSPLPLRPEHSPYHTAERRMRKVPRARCRCEHCKRR